MQFKDLHHQTHPLLICNVWDVASARGAEKINFQALGTSSSAIASMLGYKDGEQMSFVELEYIVKRIVSNVSIPVSVDLESGYSRDVSKIIDHIQRLAHLGITGINIEDSLVENKRTLLEAENFAKTLSSVKAQLKDDGIDIFLNVRTDAFLLQHPDPVKETCSRILLYEKSGADGIFTPCIEKEGDIKHIVETTDLPVNVMCMPDLPDFDTLRSLGVKRISMRNFLFDHIQKGFKNTLKSVSAQGSFNPVFKHADH
ncbi:isocitrate lyase/phosphoenolpyruvate mutase family protein [Fulvivirga sp. M361]|uniref:isocitrate lyase/PEP mutase family protein n=1 Tax=Fulvivirga sp. M361 TaxID=2594266 RepID=UPI00117AFE9D|nr:isocitrate lyase/phosphoenolpyruvate mutase family protein [Fulvivirga sp. M361]TRX48302.1 isocitrate lyase/phosphoenolpyruvate mutase family protein [Fulvivirga sp. M361]